MGLFTQHAADATGHCAQLVRDHVICVAGPFQDPDKRCIRRIQNTVLRRYSAGDALCRWFNHLQSPKAKSEVGLNEVLPESSLECEQLTLCN